jgi:hypothetical protein
LIVVSGAAVPLGRWLRKRVKLSVIRYVAAGIRLVPALLTTGEALAT